METKYEIEKIRKGRNGVWDAWEYMVPINEDQAQRLNVPFALRRELDSSRDLDSLVAKLSKLPDVRNARLVAISGLPDNQRAVSLVESCETDCLTQYGLISDEELGTLGALVQKYLKCEERKRK